MMEAAINIPLSRVFVKKQQQQQQQHLLCRLSGNIVNLAFKALLARSFPSFTDVYEKDVRVFRKIILN